MSSLRGVSPQDVSQILGVILSSQYQNSDVPFASLFNSSWAIIMELYGEVVKSRLNRYSLNFLGTILMCGRPASQLTHEEKNCCSLCEQAKGHLLSFFENLKDRQITPIQLEVIQNAGELSQTLKFLKTILSLKLFSNQQVTVDMLEKELNSYQCFTERIKKIKHFAYKFTEFSQGIYMYIIFKYIIYICRGSRTNES